MNSWEWLEGLKIETAIAVAVKQMAQLVADELLDWPPQVTQVDKRMLTRFAEVLAPAASTPSSAAFDEAIRCVRWELARDYQARDFYERNNGRAKACPEQCDQLASEFIQHYILEAFFMLMERTDYRIKRNDVVAGLDEVAHRVAQRLREN